MTERGQRARGRGTTVSTTVANDLCMACGGRRGEKTTVTRAGRRRPSAAASSAAAAEVAATASVASASKVGKCCWYHRQQDVVDITYVRLACDDAASKAGRSEASSTCDAAHTDE